VSRYDNSRPQFVHLPDGSAVWATNAVEAAILYHELGEAAIYGRHGIEVHDGDCIFDVGANIGLYSVLLLRANRRLRIFAFEPVASTYALAELNMALYRGDACITSFNCALGREAGIGDGVMDAGFSMAASLRPADVAGAVRQDAGLRVWAHAPLPDLKRLGLLSRRGADLLRLALERPLAWPLAAGTILALVAGVRWRAGGWFRKRHHFACQVHSLSDVIVKHNVSRIDVLKIDVEGSEWEVLSGLESASWPRIRQAVVEVHDVAGRLGEVVRLFRQKGFRTEVDQECWSTHRLCGIYTLYARRDGSLG
jgi:31-O-methyltransferase